MRTIYRQAEQGHAVPSQVMPARGPFQHYEPEVVDLEYDPDAFPPGATAQNGMREVVFYECRACSGVVRDTDIDHHRCKE